MKQLAVFLLGAAVLIGCKSAQKAQNTEQVTTVTKKPIEHSSSNASAPAVDSFAVAKEILTNAVNTPFNFFTFQAKAKVAYNVNGSGGQYTANIRLKKDSIIWLSLTGAFGIEGARVFITPDSVFVMNHFTNSVERHPVSYLQTLAHLPVNFYELQHFILGIPFLANSASLTSYRVFKDSAEFICQMPNLMHRLILNTNNSAWLSSFIQQQQIANALSARIVLGNYQKQNNTLFYFPAYRKIILETVTPFQVELDFKQTTWNDSSLNYPFHIPKGYRIK
jgi:hypothetical protein